MKTLREFVCAVLIFSVLWITGCPNGGNTKSTVKNPGAPPAPHFFYLDAEYSPSVDDIGKTGIYVDGTELVGISDDSDAGEVRFVNLDRENYPFSMTLLLNGWDMDGPVLFPQNLITETDGEISGYRLSEYNTQEESFTLTETSGDDEPLLQFTLNSGIFSAFQDDPSLSQSQNRRIQMLMIAVAIITVIDTQWGESVAVSEKLPGGGYAILAGGGKDKSTNFFVAIAVAVVAIAVVCITAPVAPVIALSASSAGVAITASVAITSAVGAVAAGVAAVALVYSAVLLNEIIMESYDNAPQKTRTGLPGPNGGTIIDKRDTGLDYDMEIYPSAYEPTTWESAVNTAHIAMVGALYWRLPTADEMAQIYYLHLVENKFPLEKMCQASTGFLWTSTRDGDNALALDLSVKETSPDDFSRNFSLNSINNTYYVLWVREIEEAETKISLKNPQTPEGLSNGTI